jgi:hypothetical protein
MTSCAHASSLHTAASSTADTHLHGGLGGVQKHLSHAVRAVRYHTQVPHIVRATDNLHRSHTHFRMCRCGATTACMRELHSASMLARARSLMRSTGTPARMHTP